MSAMQPAMSIKELKFEVDCLKKEMIQLIDQGHFELLGLHEEICRAPKLSLMRNIEFKIMIIKTGGKSEDPDRDIVSKIAMQLEFEEAQEKRNREIEDRRCAEKLQEAENRKCAKRLQIVKLQDEIAEAQKKQEIADLECAKRLQIADLHSLREKSDLISAQNQASEDLAKQLRDNFAAGAAHDSNLLSNIGLDWKVINGIKQAKMSVDDVVFICPECSRKMSTGDINCRVFDCGDGFGKFQHGSRNGISEKLKKHNGREFGCAYKFVLNKDNTIRSGEEHE